MWQALELSDPLPRLWASPLQRNYLLVLMSKARPGEQGPAVTILERRRGSAQAMPGRRSRGHVVRPRTSSHLCGTRIRPHKWGLPTTCPLAGLSLTSSASRVAHPGRVRPGRVGGGAERGHAVAGLGDDACATFCLRAGDRPDKSISCHRRA